MAEPERETAADGTSSDSAGRLLAIDLGAKRVGVAVCDELRITVNPLPVIERRSWKDFLRRIVALVETQDARGLVIGLPLRLDGTEGDAAKDARSVANKFQRSLDIPVYLQDERLTTFEAAANSKTARGAGEIHAALDSEAAALILRDFIVSKDKPI
ncbi:MAG: Holliday junction resolvase RuvX [Acidobacteriota bacterium]